MRCVRRSNWLLGRWKRWRWWYSNRPRSTRMWRNQPEWRRSLRRVRWWRKWCGGIGFGYRMHLSGGSEALLVPGTYDSPDGYRGPAGFAVLRRQVRAILGPPSASAEQAGWQLSALRQTIERRRPLGYHLVRRGAPGIPRPLSEAERATSAAGGAGSNRRIDRRVRIPARHGTAGHGRLANPARTV